MLDMCGGQQARGEGASNDDSYREGASNNDSFDVGGGIFLTSSTFLAASKLAGKVRVIMICERIRFL